MESIPSSIYSSHSSIEPLREAILSNDSKEIAHLLDIKEIRAAFLEWTTSHSKLLKGNLRFRKIVKIAEEKEKGQKIESEDPTSSGQIVVAKSSKTLGEKIQGTFRKILPPSPSPLDDWLNTKTPLNRKITKELINFITSKNGKGFKRLTAYYDLGLINDDQLKEILFHNTKATRFYTTILHDLDNFKLAFPFLERLSERNPQFLKELLLRTEEGFGKKPLIRILNLESFFPLYKSLANKQPQILKEVLGKDGGFLLHNSDNFKTAIPFLETLEETHPELLKDLLSIQENQGSTLLHNKKNYQQALPLLERLTENHPELLEEILIIKDFYNGNTVFHYFDFEISLSLFNNLAKKNPELFKRLLSVQNNEGKTPLHNEDILKSFILKTLVNTNAVIVNDLFSIQDASGQTPQDSLATFFKKPDKETWITKILKTNAGLFKVIAEKLPSFFEKLFQDRVGQELFLLLYFEATEEPMLQESLLLIIQNQIEDKLLSSIAYNFTSTRYEVRLLKLLKIIIEKHSNQMVRLILNDPGFGRVLIANAREDLNKFIQEQKISLQEMPLKAQLNLLPLFSPNDIASIVSQPIEEQWEIIKQLKFPIDIDDREFSHNDMIDTTAEELFDEINDCYGEAEFSAQDLYQDARIRNATPLLSQIPFSCLVAAMQNPKLIPLITGYFEAFSLAQQQIIFPLLPNATAFLLFANSKNIDNRFSFLSFATTEQKLHFLNAPDVDSLKSQNFLLLLKEAKKQCNNWEENLHLLNNKGAETNFEDIYTQLEKSFNSFSIRQGRELNDLARQLSNLKKSYLVNSDSEELENKVQTKTFSTLLAKYEKISNRIKKCQDDFAKIEKPKALSEATEADEEYDDLNMPLQDPVLGSDGRIYNQASFDGLGGKSAFSRQPIEIVEKKNLSKYPHLVEKYKEFEKLKNKINKS